MPHGKDKFVGPPAPKPKKKAKTPPAPSTHERREHAGKVPQPGVPTGTRNSGSPVTAETTEVAGPYRSQSSVKSIRSKATKHEHKQVPTSKAIAALDHIKIYQGTKEPRTKREKALASRGRAVRHILAGRSSKSLRGTTPVQSLKHTGLLRENKLKEVNDHINEISRKIEKPKLDPKSKKEYHSLLTELRSEKHRLLGRKAKANLFYVEKEQKKQGKELDEYEKKIHTAKTPKEFKALEKALDIRGKIQHKLSHAEQREQAKAKREFQLSQKKMEKASKLADESIYIPEVVGLVKEKKAQPKKTKPNPLALNSLLTKPQKPVSSIPPRLGPKYRIKEQEMPNDSWHGKIPAGIYTRGELKNIQKQSEQAATEPSALSVGLTAATIASLAVAPEAKALQLLGRGATALKATRAGAAVSGAVKEYKTLGALDKLLKTVPDTSKVVTDAVAAEKKGKTVLSFTREGMKAKYIPGKSVPKLVESLEAPPTLKARIIENAASKRNVAMETASKDSRVIAGAGSPADVNASMGLQAVKQLQVYARPALQGLELRAKRMAIKGAPGALGIIGVSLADQDFRNAALRDTHDLIAGFVPSTYQFLTASGDALAWGFTGGFYGAGSKIGSPARVEAIWDQALKTDPIALAFQGKWDKAYKAFKERPVSGLIELGGAYTAVGKAAGSFARSLPESFSVNKLASTTGRQSEDIIGDLRIYRDYSPNVITKGFQVMGDRANMKFLEGSKPKLVNGKLDYGSRAKNLAAKNEGEKYVMKMEKSADEMFALGQIGERSNRAQAEHGVGEVGKKAHKVHKLGPHALWPIATGVVRSRDTAIADLMAWKQEIEAKFDPESLSDIANSQRETLDLVNHLIQNPQIFRDKRTWDAVEDFRQQENARQDELVASGALNPEARKYAPWIPYAVRHMGAKFDAKKGAFTIDGKKLTLKEIKQHSRQVSKMTDEPVMISTQRVDAGDGARQTVLALPNADTWKSTGEHIENGTADIAFSSLARQAVLSRSIIDKRRFYITTLDRASLRIPGQSHPVYFASKEDAAKFANKHLGEHVGPKLIPVNLSSFIERMDEVRKTDVTKMIGGKRAERLYGDMNKLLNDALTSGPDAEGKFVLIPERMVERLNQHAKYEYGVGKVIRRINREFKGSVLAFSPKWHVGNIVDMFTRLYFEGAGVTSAFNGERLLREVKSVDEQAYNDILTIIGGGHLSHAADSLGDLTNVDRALFDAFSSSQRRALASAIRMGPRAYRAAQRTSFGLAQQIEHHLRTVAIGKAAKNEAKRIGVPWHKAIMMQPHVIEKLAQGIIDDKNVMTRYGKLVNKTMGDYTTMSPEFRAAMLTYMPFLLWARASTKWVLALPANSPIRTAMIASVNRLNEDERRKLGLSKFKEHANTVPGYMLGSLPSLSGDIPGDEPKSLYRTNAYTSFGPLTDFSGLGNFILPQYKSILDAYSGLDWTGSEIVNKNGKPISNSQRVGIMLQLALETYVAPIGIAHHLLAEGDPSSTFTLFKTGKPPWEGITDRKATKRPGRGGRYGKTEVVESPKYPFALSATEGILAKQFSPLYKSPNFIVEGNRSEKKAEKDAELIPSEEDETSWLYGEKDTSKGNTPKRKHKLAKKNEEKESSWLYGE